MQALRRILHRRDLSPIFAVNFAPSVRLMGKKRVVEPAEIDQPKGGSPKRKKAGVKSATSPSPPIEKGTRPTKSAESIPYSELVTREIPVSAGRFVRIMTWNVAGLRGTLKKSPTILQTLVQKYDLDFLCIQETKVSAEQIKNELGEDILPGYKAYWCSSVTKKGYSGTAVFVNMSTFDTTTASEDATQAAVTTKSKTKKMTDFFSNGAKKSAVAASDTKLIAPAPNAALKGSILRKELDLQGTSHTGEGRTIMLELDTFFLVACYVPNSGRNLERLDYRVNEWEPYMRSYLKALSSSKPVVYTGDLNVAHLDLDIYNFDAKHIAKQSGCTPRERCAFGEMLSEGFVDAFRHFHPNASGHYTYWSQMTFARNTNRGLRLDYFVCSNDLADEASAPRIKDCYDIPTDTIGVSDHAPAMLIMEI